ncbi:hypothetical protein LC612_39170 [Nostoc sp. CHAB 5834]|nr:hypothetical protein [Nostoc sp. CHAB 5834]
MKRAQKIDLLTKVVNGQANLHDLKRLQNQQAPCFMVVTDNGKPKLTDLVHTRLADEQGRKLVPYGEFLKNPIVYGSFCITEDQQL